MTSPPFVNASAAPPRRRVALAALVFVAATTLTMWWQASVGIARDEAVYMHAGDRYARWWGRWLTGDGGGDKAAIAAAWGGPRDTDNNREHPPLIKTLMGASHAIAVNGFGARGTAELASYRVIGALFMGLLALVCFVWASQLWGVAAGAWASLFVMCMPRVLGYASVACFDVPIATLWLACTYAYWRAQTSRRWCVALALVLGAALATKHNALILPWVFGLHSLIVTWRQGRASHGSRWRALRARWPIVVAMACAPLVLLLLWPWLWLAPVDHTVAWLRFHLTHVHYNYEYLGTNYNAPPFPWHVPLVTTALTVPLVTLVAAVLGGVSLWVHRARARLPGEAAQDPTHGAVSLLIISGSLALAPFMLGSTPIFGAEKHWLAALAVIAMVAGVGAARAMAALAERRGGTLARACCGLLIAVALGQELHAGHRGGLAHYNALAGGASGGADLGMNRQYWGLSARQALPALAGLAAPAGAGASLKIYTHDAAPAWAFYRRFGMVPGSWQDSGAELRGIEAADLALVIHEKHFARHEAMIWQAYQTAAPAQVITAAGVPVVSIYVNPQGRAATGTAARHRD
ncbi:MAG: glycosyltransferase family 39 protein [Myxococcales bacterium]|nr:glycosyltransferase family 39 protein [Myxococcales bacterium]